eukprot:s449_g3.t1
MFIAVVPLPKCRCDVDDNTKNQLIWSGVLRHWGALQTDDDEAEGRRRKCESERRAAPDVLDPRLSRDVAYPEEVADKKMKKKLREGKQPAALKEGDAKRPASAVSDVFSATRPGDLPIAECREKRKQRTEIRKMKVRNPRGNQEDESEEPSRKSGATPPRPLCFRKR